MYLKRLKDLREDKDLYQKQVADLIEVSQQYYSEYELGNRPIPIDKLIKLADFYKVNLDYIVGRTFIKEQLPKRKGAIN